MFDPLMIVAATQIIIESLPISSSGHMMLTEHVLQWHGIMSEFTLPEALNDVLHIPTLVIVAIYFYGVWFTLLVRMLRALWLWYKRGSWSVLPDSNKHLLLMVAKIIGMVACADTVTVCWYVGLKLLARQGIIIEGIPILAVGFAITATLLLRSRKKFSPNHHHFLLQSTLLGFVQGMALLPGISRFASTVVTSRMLGLSWRRSLQCSFLLFTPLMIAAISANALPALLFDAACVQFLQPIWFALYAGSSIVAYYLFVLACRLVIAGRLWWFGVYMALPFAVSVLLML